MPSCLHDQIFDGGSTGSRLHVFEFVQRKRRRGANVDAGDADAGSSDRPDEEEISEEDEVEEDVVRRGSFRVDSPLSAFAAAASEAGAAAVNSTALAEHLMPALAFAETVVPAEFRATTRVHYQATAGMRLLSKGQQEGVYDAVYEGLLARPDFAFRDGFRRSDVATLSGDLEGYYGAVAANYLKGTIRPDLRMLQRQKKQAGAGHDGGEEEEEEGDHHHHHGPYGALDMGGASTQIVFLPSGKGSGSRSGSGRRMSQNGNGSSGSEEYQYCSNDEVDGSSNGDDDCGDASGTSCNDDDHNNDDGGFPSRLDEGDFFSTSYLSYGVDQFRERLWNTWISERKRQVGDGADDTCDTKLLPNPCCFKGYEIEWQGYTLVGTGDTDRCIREVQRLIPHPEEEEDSRTGGGDGGGGRRRTVGGVEHPPVRGKFFAMSLYFFALDCLRELSRPSGEAHDRLNESWPNPTIRELGDALDGLCSRSWTGDLEDVAGAAHAYTRPEVLPHRCLEAVYMVTLLRDGFGFDVDSRDITFTFLVDGSEVEWTLGMALALRAQQRKTVGNSGSIGSSSSEECKVQHTTIASPGSHSTSSSSSSAATFGSTASEKRKKNDTMEEEGAVEEPPSAYSYIMDLLLEVVKTDEAESHYVLWQQSVR